MPFDRWVSSREKSFAWEEFKKNHTQINYNYWAFVPSANFVKAQTRTMPIEENPRTFFPIRSEDRDRIPDNFGKWRGNYSEFENWVRTSAILTAASHLEMYVRRISFLSFLSNPGLLWDSKKRIDGVPLLKAEADLGWIKAHIDRLIKGDWPLRISALEAYLRKKSPELRSLESSLEFIRKTRNSVAHTSGQDISLWSPFEFDELSRIRVSDGKLKKILGSVEEAAKIYEKIFRYDLGEFEYIYLYHKSGIPKQKTHQDRIGLFANHMSKKLGRTFQRDIYTGVVAYYDAVLV